MRIGVPAARRTMSCALCRSAPRWIAPTGASRCWRGGGEGGPVAGGIEPGRGIRRRVVDIGEVEGHQRTLRTRATARAPAKANTAPSTKTSTNDPVATHRGRADQRADRLRHRRGDVHDAEVLAARGRVGQHLGGERLVDREEASVAEAEDAGGDHRDGEVGEDREEQGRDALQARGEEDERLASAEAVGEPAEQERGEDHEHHVDEREHDEVGLGVVVVELEHQEVEQQARAERVADRDEHAAEQGPAEVGVLARADPEAREDALRGHAGALRCGERLVVAGEERDREHDDDHREQGVAERLVGDELGDEQQPDDDADRLRRRHPSRHEAALADGHLVGDRRGERGGHDAEADGCRDPRRADRPDLGLQPEHDEREREDERADRRSTGVVARTARRCGRRARP